MRLVFSSTLQRVTAALVLSAALSPAFALPVMEMRAEDFLPMAAELKKSLNLNPNQQTLWQQTESKTRNLLRERQARRERLQAATLAGTRVAGAELRDLAKAIDEETATSANEEKLMREWWLTVNDALNETQRQAVVQLVGEQLLRVPDNGGSHEGAAPRKEGGERHSGGRKGGMGGSVGGPGGASINLPGGGG
jgi:translation initiation factor 1 (eIF-1/SUI1)